ncbi:MAG: Uma2 family endonuclease [Gemmatimonadaceae bacterium]
MPLSQTEWTAEMLNDFPDDGNRYEVIDGELFVTPSPADIHQYAVGELYALLLPYAKLVGVNVLTAPSAVRFSDRREVQPDLYVTPRLPNGQRPEKFTDIKMLLLAVEVLSPSTMRTDRVRKRTLYQDEHVADYWIVDTASRAIEHWTPRAVEADIRSATVRWQPVRGHEPLIIDVAHYFREVFGE